jgi:ABC-type methionine transport system ATPase subunit
LPFSPTAYNARVAAQRFHLTFPGELAREPVIHTLSSRFDLVPTIRRASLEEGSGWMIIEVEGPDDRVNEAVEWLNGQGVKVETIDTVE